MREEIFTLVETCFDEQFNKGLARSGSTCHVELLRRGDALRSLA